jgi:hypothetical protein
MIECNWRLWLNSGDDLEVNIAVLPWTFIPHGGFWLAIGKNLCEAHAGDPLNCSVKPVMMVMSVKAVKKCLCGGSQ